MAEETATFALKIDADAEPAAEAAAELEKFRAAIVKSQGAMAEYRKSMALLKGTSDEVKDAKAKLKAALDIEKGKVTQANLGILRLGGSYEKLTKAQKKGKVETDAGRKAITAVGGPMKSLTEKFDGLKDLLPIVSTGWGALAAGVAVGVLALALAATAVADLTVKFSEWLITTADANRNLQLTREAFSGSAKNATAWGHVIDWASEKTALTTAQMNELVVSTEKTYRGFRISGQGMVDAFKASAAAAGAGRPEVASFFDEIISRGKKTGRSFVSPADFAQFRNAGISVKDLYKELGITAGQAGRGALVSTDKMAASLRKLSENRFAEINGKKMLSLGSQWDRLTDNFMRFTNDLVGEGGALEPLLKAIQSVASAFDLTTDSGQAMKASVTKYGGIVADAITKHLPDIKAFVLEAMKLGGAFISGASAVLQFAQSGVGLALIKGTLVGIAVAAGLVALALLPVVVIGAAIALAFVAVGLVLYGMYAAIKWIAGLDWGGIGKAIVDGIKAGLTAAWEGLKAAVTTMGEGIKNTFKSLLGISSPSTVFAGFGVQSGAGYSQGLTRATPAVAAASAGVATAAVSAAAPAPATPAGGGGGRSMTIGTIENHFLIGAGKGADEVKAVLSSRSFLDDFERSLRILLQSQGIPTGSPSSSGG